MNEITDDQRFLEDGFGNHWAKCDKHCRMQIVRPGKTQCECEEMTPAEMLRKIDSLEQSRKDLRARNKALCDQMDRYRKALGNCHDTSIAVQYLAERCGYTKSPAVRQIVENLDLMSRLEEPLHEIRAPYELEPEEDKQAGDAEMVASVDPIIADAEQMTFSLAINGFKGLKAKNVADTLQGLMDLWYRAVSKRVNEIKQDHGHKPVPVTVVPDIHFSHMTEEQLRDFCSNLGWLALDLAQHLSFTRDMLRLDLRAGAYAKAQGMAYELSSLAINWKQPERFDVVVLGNTGLERPEL